MMIVRVRFAPERSTPDKVGRAIRFAARRSAPERSARRKSSSLRSSPLRSLPEKSAGAGGRRIAQRFDDLPRRQFGRRQRRVRTGRRARRAHGDTRRRRESTPHAPRRPREGRPCAGGVAPIAAARRKQRARVVGRHVARRQRARLQPLHLEPVLHDDQPLAHMIDDREVVADEDVGQALLLRAAASGG